MLQQLKRKINRNSSTKTVHRYEVTWNYLENQDEDQTTDSVYLKSFCDKFVSDIKRGITSSLEDNKEIRLNLTAVESDPLQEELLHHGRLQYSKTVDFCGRENLIDAIVEKILDDKNHQPIVLVGRSGCGKTALMAKLVERMRGATPESAIIIYRFLGTSPESSSIHKVLKNIVLQLSIIYNYETPPSHTLQNVGDLVDRLGRILRKVSSELKSCDEMLLIFLDSIDQLSLEDGARRMHWLPKILPPHVKIVISSLPGMEYEIVPLMRKYVEEDNIFAVEGVTMEVAKEIAEKYLKMFDRKLTVRQLEKVLQAFENSPYPLFLKLILEEAKRWRSHFNVEQLILPDSARAAIAKYYERLEKEHGKIIVSSALSFIIAARDGVTENELLDLLSLDDQVLHEAYQYWSPPTENSVRVPSFTWTRLKHDLSNYIVKRQATGHTVLALLHRQFIEVGREMYLHSDNASRIYEILSDFFLGSYSAGNKKSLKLSMWDSSREMDRRVASQPVRYSHAVYNVRKLRELPFCLLKAGKLEILKTSVLGNAEWLLAKSTAFSIKEVIEDYNMYLNEHKDFEIKLIKDSLLLAKPTLEFQGGIRNHLFTELFCRLEYYAQKFPKYVGYLVKECSDLLLKDDREMLKPMKGYFPAPGGPLRTTVTGFKLPVTCLKYADDGNVFVAASQDGVIIVWDGEHDELLQKIDAHTGSIICIDTDQSAGMKIASCAVDGLIRAFDAENGSKIFEERVPHSNSTVLKVFIRSKSISCVMDNKIVSWDFQNKQQMFQEEFETAISAASDRNSNDEHGLWVGFQSGQFSFIDIATGENRISKSNVKFEVLDILFPEAGKLLILWNNGTVGLADDGTTDILDSICIGDVKIIDWTRTVNNGRFDCATEDSIFNFSIYQDKLKIIGSPHKQDKKIQSICRIDGKKLAVAYHNKKAIVLNVSDNLHEIGDVWEGMGASIDHMIVGNHVGVTASNKVFYMKIWDLHDDEKQVLPSTTLPLSAVTSNLNRTGEEVAFVDSNQLIITNVMNEEQHKKTPLPNANNAIIALKFPENDVIISYKDGTICKVIRKILDTEQHILSTSEVCDYVTSRPLQITHFSSHTNGSRCMAVARGHDQQIVLLIGANLEMKATIKLTSRQVSGDVTSSCFLDGEKWDILLGTSTGVLHRMEFDTNQGVVVSNAIAAKKHENAITCLCVSTNNMLLFSGSLGRTRRLWNIVNDKAPLLRHELKFHSLLTSGVTCAQFSSDGKYVVTGSNERSITVWDTEKGTLIGSQYVYATVLDIAINEKSEVVFTNELGYIGKVVFRRPNVTLHKKQRSRACVIV